MVLLINRARAHALGAWIHAQLGTGPIAEDELAERLKSGVVLIRLMESVCGVQMREEYYKEPERRYHFIHNLHSFCMFSVALGLNLKPSAAVAAFLSNSADAITPYLFRIARFKFMVKIKRQTEWKESNMKEMLLNSVRRLLPADEIVDLGASWTDGRLLCRLVDAMAPNVITPPQPADAAASPEATVRLALEAARRVLGVPALLEPRHVMLGDEACMMLYLSSFFSLTESRESPEDSATLVMQLEMDITRRIGFGRQLSSELAQHRASVAILESEAQADARELRKQEEAIIALREKIVRAAEERDALRRKVTDVDAKLLATRGDTDAANNRVQQDLEVWRAEKAALAADVLHYQRGTAGAMKDIRGMMGALQFAAADQTANEKQGKLAVEPPTGWVTLMFSDVENSTLLWETDGQMMSEALAEHNRIIREQLVKFQGYEVKTEGDAFMVAFSDPVAAVRCALGIQEQLLTTEKWPAPILRGEHRLTPIEKGRDGKLLFRGLRVRIGMHSGIPICVPDPVTGRVDYFGSMVNRAARTESVAAGGQILISDSLFGDLQSRMDELTEMTWTELGLQRFKGFDHEMLVFQIAHTSLAGRSVPARRDAQQHVLEDRVANLKDANRVILEKMHALQQHLTAEQHSDYVHAQCKRLCKILGEPDYASMFATLHVMFDAYESDSRQLAVLRKDSSTLLQDVNEMRTIIGKLDDRRSAPTPAPKRVSQRYLFATPAPGAASTPSSRVSTPNLGASLSRTAPSTPGVSPAISPNPPPATLEEWQIRVARLQAEQDALRGERVVLEAQLTELNEVRREVRGMLALNRIEHVGARRRRSNSDASQDSDSATDGGSHMSSFGGSQGGSRPGSPPKEGEEPRGLRRTSSSPQLGHRAFGDAKPRAGSMAALPGIRSASSSRRGSTSREGQTLSRSHSGTSKGGSFGLDLSVSSIESAGSSDLTSFHNSSNSSLGSSVGGGRLRVLPPVLEARLSAVLESAHTPPAPGQASGPTLGNTIRTPVIQLDPASPTPPTVNTPTVARLGAVSPSPASTPAVPVAPSPLAVNRSGHEALSALPTVAAGTPPTLVWQDAVRRPRAASEPAPVRTRDAPLRRIIGALVNHLSVRGGLNQGLEALSGHVPQLVRDTLASVPPRAGRTALRMLAAELADRTGRLTLHERGTLDALIKKEGRLQLALVEPLDALPESPTSRGSPIEVV